MAGDLLVAYPLTPTLSPKGAREKKDRGRGEEWCKIKDLPGP